MKKRLIKLVCVMLFTFIALIMAGCGTQNYSIRINDDNTVSYTIRITVDTTTYELLGSYGIDINELNRTKNTYGDEEIDMLDAVFQEQAMLYKQHNFSITAVTDTVEVGFEAHKDYASIEEFNQEVKELYNKQLVGTDVEIIKEENSFGTTYKVYGSLEYILDEDVNLDDPSIKENFKNVYNKSKLTSSLSVAVPPKTAISATDGSQNDKIVTWETIYDETGSTKEVHVISEQKNKGFYAVVIIAAAIGFLILTIVSIKIYKNMRNKKKS